MEFLRSRTIPLTVIFAGAVLVSGTARAEFDFVIYFGNSWAQDGDVTLRQADGTETTFSSVSWETESLTEPPYYGGRFAYYFEKMPGWGIALDFTHDKLKADPDQSSLAPTFDHLEFSHGHNLVTMNGLYRWTLGKGKGGFRGRLRPYTGFGVGIGVTHVEVDLDGGSRTNEYQRTAPAVQALGGLDLAAVRHFSVVFEYKVNYARIDVDLNGGGSLRTNPWTHQLILGFSFNFGRENTWSRLGGAAGGSGARSNPLTQSIGKRDSCDSYCAGSVG